MVGGEAMVGKAWRLTGSVKFQTGFHNNVRLGNEQPSVRKSGRCCLTVLAPWNNPGEQHQKRGFETKLILNRGRSHWSSGVLYLVFPQRSKANQKLKYDDEAGSLRAKHHFVLCEEKGVGRETRLLFVNN